MICSRSLFRFTFFLLKSTSENFKGDLPSQFVLFPLGLLESDLLGALGFVKLDWGLILRLQLGGDSGALIFL